MLQWDLFLKDLETKLSQESISKWVKSLRIARFDARNLYLEADEPFQVGWFEEHVRPHLKTAFLGANGKPISVTLSLRGSAKKEKTEEAISPILADPLEKDYTLENFLPLHSNLIGHKLISEVISSEDFSFNPIFIYGPKNSGKTHLLSAAAHAFRDNGQSVFFVRAETFTEHVVQAMRKGYMTQFRKVYRDIDVLIVDDLHIFSRKRATQEEFFHTFNTLHTMGRQIILSADRAPSHLIDIEPRLISRFEWGLSVGLEDPDPSPILEKKAELWNFPLSAALKAYLIETFPKKSLQALQILVLRGPQKGFVSPDEAARLLKDFVAKEKENSLTPDKIVKSVAAHYGVKVEDLLGKSQMKESAFPRQIAMYLCREKLNLPFQKIGSFFQRDHSTVMSSVKQIKKGIEEKKGELLQSLREISEKTAN